MQTSDNMSTPRDVHFDDTLAATRGRSSYYFSFATWPIGVGTPRNCLSIPNCVDECCAGPGERPANRHWRRKGRRPFSSVRSSSAYPTCR